MDKLSDLKPGDVLGQVDLASYIGAMAMGVAEAQRALDDNTIGLLGAFTQKLDGLAGKSLIQLGLSPAFYHFRSATISASVTMSIQVRQEIDVKVHFEAGKSSSSSSTTQTSFKQIKSTSEKIRVSESREVSASSFGSVMERLDSYSKSNSNDQLIVTERQSLANAQSFQQSGMALYKADAALFVVPPAGMRWAVLSIPATSGALAIQINSSGPKYPSAATTSAQAFAAGLAQHVTNVSIAPLPPSATGGLKVVKFETGSHVVKTVTGNDYAARLRALAHIINAAPIAALTLVGHTDGVGTREYNQRLSVLRAQAVRDVLVANGVSTSGITVKGVGEQGVTDNMDDPEARNVTISFDTEPTGYFLFLCERSANALAELMVDSICIASAEYPASGTVAGLTVHSSAEVAAAVNAGSDAQASQFQELVYLTNRESSSGDVAKVTVFATQESSSAGGFGLDLEGESSESSELEKKTLSTVNRAAAIAGSLDVRFARMFDVSMSGNMSIAAELVSVPAPAEFLQFIKDNQGD